VRYWNTKRQGFLPECEGFSLNSVYGSELKIFCGICVKGQALYSAKVTKIMISKRGHI
jgi:hypothetical protein